MRRGSRQVQRALPPLYNGARVPTCLETCRWFIDMNTVTVSPKFQGVIPLALREALRLSPGEKLRVMHYQDRVEFIPVRPIKKMRGFLRGIDTRIKREADRL